MANQIVTTTVNYDSAVISGLLDGESITINGGALTIDADTRWNQQAAVFGNIPVSSTLGGVVAIDGTQAWEVPFSASTGNVPTQAALGSNGVTGGTSGATGELTRVWASGSFTPATAGDAMPAAGFIKLRTKTGNFQAGETITLPGGATIVATSAGKRSWMHVVGNAAGSQALIQPRMANVTVYGDWYALGSTDGSDNQTVQMPVRDEFPAVQIETSPSSGVYEWWVNAADSWNGHYPNVDAWTVTNTTITRNNIAGPATYPASERFRETTANAVHSANGATWLSAQMDAGSYTHSAIVKQETRQWCVVQISTNGGTDRYGALVDLAAGTIIANPSVGSPTGTSSSITSLGGGWYKVDVTLTHSTGNLTSFIALSNSATPTYASGLPTYTGSASEGIYTNYSAVIQSTHAFIPTDVRGKFFYSDPFAGTITFAKRGTNNAGYKPVSGCAIRIPNLILGSSSSGDYTAQHISTVNRYTFSIIGAVVDMDKVTCNWFLSGAAPTSFKLQNSSWAWSFGLFNFSSEIRNSCIAPVLYINASSASLSFANSANAYVYDSRIVRGSGTAFSATSSANINTYRCRFEQIKQIQGKSQRTASSGSFPNTVNIVSSGGEFVDGTVVAGSALFSVQNYSIRNTTHCDNLTGTTPAVSSRSVGVQGTNIVVDGLSALAGIDNNHPYADWVGTTAFTANLTIKNIASAASPLNSGTVNATGNFVALSGSAGTNVEIRRCYAINLRSTPISQASACPVVTLYDVWADGASQQVFTTANAISRGGKWTNTRTGSPGNSGTHWDDAYTSTTTGLITIMANEPTTASAAQCTATLGVGSGFNGSGSMIISKLTDVVTWTTPLKIYGHNYLAGGCALAGTDCQNLIFEYKIDTGSGFGGSWTFLANTVRRALGGTSGQNQVTVTTADRTALTRQPQIGDFVQSGTFKLPANTTVTNVSGDVITCSNNFTGNLASNEFVTFSPVNVAVSAANGYSLQVRTYPTAAATTTLLTAFSMGIQTDATAQRTQHPLPGSLVNVTNLVPQSRVKVTRVDTGAILQQASCGAGTSLAFDFQYAGAVQVEARNASGTPTYEPWVTQVTISPATPTNIVALQEPD